MRFTVQTLIDELQTVENKDLPVYAYIDGEPIPVTDVDKWISDRLDLNCGD